MDARPDLRKLPPIARLARVAAVGIPHHVTHRGNRRQPTFFSDDDDLAYRNLLAEGCRAAGLSEAEHGAIRAGERTGRPLGSADFVGDLERRLGRVLARQRPGPKPWRRVRYCVPGIPRPWSLKTPACGRRSRRPQPLQQQLLSPN